MPSINGYFVTVTEANFLNWFYRYRYRGIKNCIGYVSTVTKAYIIVLVTSLALFFPQWLNFLAQIAEKSLK
jgi:hypothetical protein